MSLALRIVSAIALLGTALAIQLAGDCLVSWHAVERAALTRRAANASSNMLDAASALAAERGLMNGLLAAPAATPRATQEAIATQRAKADVALQAGMGGLDGIPVLDPGALGAAVDAMHAAAARVDALRRAAEQAVQGTAVAPTQPVWFAAATGQIEAVTRIRRLLDAAGNEESDVTRLIAVRDALSDMAEFTGRERGRINGVIAAKARLEPAALLEIGALRGRVDAAWGRIQGRLDALPPDAAGPVRAAGVATFETFAAQRGPVFEAAARGADWPISAPGWFAAATAAIDAVHVAQVAAGEALDATTHSRAQAGWRRFAVAVGWWIGALCVVVLTAWYVRFRVVRPLDQAIGSLHALTGGDLDVVVPPARGHDEIGRLLRATHRFQATARAHHALEESQAELQRQADAGRVQAVRDIGALIEEETGQAVGGVVGLAERLAQISADVRRDATAIAAAARVSADTAAEGLRESDAAATAAHGLNDAIRDVAQQMDHAAATTRGVVSRTTETRESFAALFASVTEVREVARLIGDIAGRTNLLALNATIEAARAGEAGKGFAVVATEVKNLASQTAQSTEHIAARVGAIDTAARRAQQALDGIVGAVDALDAIATQVAAAVEEQSAATGQIAAAVEGASVAARRTAEQVSGMADLATSCSDGVAAMQAIGTQTVQQISGLQNALVAILRSRVAELNRRDSDRVPVALPARLIHAGGTTTGLLRDLSAGGARFSGAALAASTAQLQAAGLPNAAVRVVGRSEDALHLAFAFASDDERHRMAEAVARLTAAPVTALAA
ncbi:MAG: methyl-accepting chemotaxis protein [Acetobacteraceae bacterium]|nr:methyl-accepting chemotaxis protein [Acetobacteraceae bacterium]